MRNARRHRFAGLAVGLVVGGLIAWGLGCGSGPREAAPIPESPASQPSPGGSTPYLDRAQTGLPTVTLWMGPAVVTAEVASSATQIATGLMHREALAEDRGMLFVFTRPHRTSFYMKNTLIPLSLAYVGADGEILEIHEGKPLSEAPMPAQSDRIQYVLEVNRGWFQEKGVMPGMVIRTERGSLSETFFGR